MDKINKIRGKDPPSNYIKNPRKPLAAIACLSFTHPLTVSEDPMDKVCLVRNSSVAD